MGDEPFNPPPFNPPESSGGCFIVEGMVPPAGGPPPHVHHFEDESFYMLEGSATFTVGDRSIKASPGDFIHVPRGVVHSIKNESNANGRALIIITPAGSKGMQQFFEESFTATTDRNATPPPLSQELLKRMIDAAERNGMEIIPPSPKR
jgi:quercetin dioxygenase-like cupin family protein